MSKVYGRSSSLEMYVEKVKPESQISIGVFWAAVDAYFFAVAENDFLFLMDKPLDESLFLITPKLQAAASKANSLSLKIITMLLDENLKPRTLHTRHVNDHAKEAPTAQDSVFRQAELPEIPDLKNRIVKELKFVGIGTEALSLSEDFARPQENLDSDYLELKCLQYKLREVSAINKGRKARLSAYLKSKMASIEYFSILDELDKQLESVYVKKYKSLKKKKKYAAVDIGQECGGSDLLTIMKKRKLLIENFSSFVLPRSTICTPCKDFIQPSEEAEQRQIYQIAGLSDAAAQQAYHIAEMETEIHLWPLSSASP